MQEDKPKIAMDRRSRDIKGGIAYALGRCRSFQSLALWCIPFVLSASLLSFAALLDQINPTDQNNLS